MPVETLQQQIARVLWRDPNGIRTRVTAVKGRCPGPLDDRVTKPGNIRIVIFSRKANRQIVLSDASLEAVHDRYGYRAELTS